MADKQAAKQQSIKEETDKAQVAETTEATEAVETKKAPKRRKRVRRSVPAGQAHVYASFNNTIITFTDNNGNALSTSSAGSNGFRGSKKGTAYAAQVAAEAAGRTAKSQYGLTRADIFVRGIGMGRDSAVRAIANLDIQIENLTDVTGVPHGGVRPRKARRV